MDDIEAQEPPMDPQQNAVEEATEGHINADELIGQMQLTPELKPIFQKALLSGMRIMFSKDSHKMFLDQLGKPGDLAAKLSEGIVALVYMLWTQSNQTLPPQIIVPLTVALTLKAYEFLEQSGEEGATPAVLGQAMETAIETIKQKFGAGGAEQPGAAPAQPAAPPAGGLLAQGATQ